MIKQKGYIGLTIVVFMLMLSMIVFPWGHPLKDEEDCTVGEAPPSYDIELRGIPAIKDMLTPAESDFSGNDPIYGGPDPDEKSNFVLIRTNVPTSKKTTPAGWLFLGGAEATSYTHTVNLGVLPEKPGYDAYYPSRWGEMDLPGKGRKYLRNMGILLFANNDPSTIRGIGDDAVYMMDIYQDRRIFDDKEKGYTEGEIFICGIDTEVGKSSVFIPTQASSQKKEQLQLEWFLLRGEKLWGIHCKPAVYLYPERKQLVNVKVIPKGELSYTDPPYDKEKGWTATAFPSGNLEVQSSKFKIQNYDYLYYESKILDSEIEKPETGWVVRYSELESLYNRVLPQLGLNKKEQADFTDYWLSKLPVSPFYYVGLMDKNQRDYLEVLEVLPKPDTSIRFSLYFEPLKEPIIVNEPEIVTPKRDGFTLVDWGGMIKLHKDTPFTCSQ